MKKLLISLVSIGIAIGIVFSIFSSFVYATTVLYPGGGGTGTSTSPIYGQVLVGNSGGTYSLTATSSLGISGSGGSTASTTLLSDTNTWTGVQTWSGGFINNATSTGTKGFNIGGGCFAISGVCIGGSSGSGTIGSGTTGQFPFYASSGTALTATSTLFLVADSANLTGSVDIGTTTAYSDFQVYSTRDSASVVPIVSFSDNNIGNGNPILSIQNDNSGIDCSGQCAATGLSIVSTQNSFGNINTGNLIDIQGNNSENGININVNGGIGSLPSFKVSDTGNNRTVTLAQILGSVKASRTLNITHGGTGGIDDIFSTLGKLGMGTVPSTAVTSPFFGMVTATSTVPIFELSTTTGAILTEIDQFGHHIYSANSVPSVSSCGTGSPTLGTLSSDVVGDVTTGVAATSCTITFGTAYTTIPEVLITGGSAASVTAVTSRSTTGFTIGLGTASTGDDISYLVIQP